MKLSGREQKILLYAGGALVAVLAWVFVFQNAQERNMILAQENMELQNQVNVLQTLAANEKRYKKETRQMKGEIAKIYQCFPAEIKEETVIMYGCGLEENAQVHINNINIASRNLAFGTEADEKETTGETKEKGKETTGKTKEEGKETTGKTEEKPKKKTGKEIYLYNTNAEYQFQVTYEGIKSTIDYIFKDEKKRTIRSLALAFDEETGGLLGSLKVDFYGLDGTGASYEEPWIPSIPIGEKNIFGTIE